MNPIKFECENFRSYKKISLSFNDDGVIPIIGDNGAGKSSIFYGISLALYGKVLIDDVEVPIKDLILQDNSTEMMVKLLFMHNMKTYSIERIYKKTVSKSEVEKYDQVKCEFLEIIGDSKILLSNKSKGSTNAKIISILGKDCSNFCNSIFFPQGEEDRLAKLTPSKFVEEISKLKNITVWEKLRVKASKEFDDINYRVESIELYIKDSIDEISHKEEISSKIKELDVIIKNKRDDIQNLENKLSDLSINKNNASNLLEQVNRIESDIKDLKEEILEIEDDIKLLNNNVVECNNVINNKDSIINKKNKKDSLLVRKTEIDNIVYEKNRLMTSFSIVDKEVRQAEYNINSELSRLKNDKNNYLLQIGDKIKVVDRYDYCNNFLKSLDLLQNEYDQLVNINQQYTVDVAKLNSRNEQLQTMINDEVNRVKKIINTCTCSECERPIDNNGLEQIKSYKTVKIDEYKTEGRDNLIKVQNLNDLKTKNQESLLNMKSQLSHRSNCIMEIGQLQNRISSIDLAEKNIVSIEPRMLELETALFNKNYSDKIKDLDILKNQLSNIIYDENEYLTIANELKTLQDVESMLYKLKNSEEQLPINISKLNDLNIKAKNKRKKVSDLEVVFNSSNKQTILQSLEQLSKDEINIKNSKDSTKREFDLLMKEFGSNQTVLDNIIKKEEKIKDKRIEMDELKKESYLYKCAIDMYGKQGIPTLIIESMLPQIEKEANSLLQLMNSEHSIRFDRPRKSDGTYMDKIVIMIRDKRGKKRPFNTYSGAEAFQISFALRVAICGSEDVMFIDEGFGKLDEKNRGLAIKILGALKSKFSKIILITHIESLKDMFDIRLKVELDSNNFSTIKWIRE